MGRICNICSRRSLVRSCMGRTCSSHSIYPLVGICSTRSCHRSCMGRTCSSCSIYSLVHSCMARTCSSRSRDGPWLRRSWFHSMEHPWLRPSCHRTCSTRSCHRSCMGRTCSSCSIYSLVHSCMARTCSSRSRDGPWLRRSWFHSMEHPWLRPSCHRTCSSRSLVHSCMDRTCNIGSIYNLVHSCMDRTCNSRNRRLSWHQWWLAHIGTRQICIQHRYFPFFLLVLINFNFLIIEKNRLIYNRLCLTPKHCLTPKTNIKSEFLTKLFGSQTNSNNSLSKTNKSCSGVKHFSTRPTPDAQTLPRPKFCQKQNASHQSTFRLPH